MKRTLLLFLILAGTRCCLYASTLNVETDYRNRALSYSNLDFNTGTSTDAVSYSTQRLRLTFRGLFDTGSSNMGEQVEICTKLQALEIIGSSITVPSFSWQNNLPYPNKSFTPFIEQSYIRISNFTKLKAQLTIGRQPLEYGSGLIIADNGVGYDAMRVAFEYPPKINFDILISAKIKTGFAGKGDFGVNGLMIKTPWKKSKFEAGYFMENDDTGSIYYKTGGQSAQTKSIKKDFYDFRLSNSEETSYYNMEIAMQNGLLTKIDNSEISLDNGGAFILSGGMIQKGASGSAVVYRGGIYVASGDSDINSIDKPDTSFSPSFGKKFDGLELSGNGTFMGMSPTTTLLDVNKNNYSGYNAINFGITYSPTYELGYGIDGFMFSASQAGSKLGLQTSNFEKNFLQSKYNLGNELNAFLKYSPSKYFSFRVTYARYTPPTYNSVWPKSEPCEMFLFETNCFF